MKRWLLSLFAGFAVLGGGTVYTIGYLTEQQFTATRGLPVETREYQRGILSSLAQQTVFLPPTGAALPRQFELQHHIQHSLIVQPTRILTRFSADQSVWLAADTRVQHDGRAEGRFYLLAHQLGTRAGWQAGEGAWQWAQPTLQANFQLPAAYWRSDDAKVVWQAEAVRLQGQFQLTQDSEGRLRFDGFSQYLGDDIEALHFQGGQLIWSSHPRGDWLDVTLTLTIEQLRIAGHAYHSAELNLHMNGLNSAAWLHLVQTLNGVLAADPAMRWLAALSLVEPLQAVLQGLPEITLDQLILRDDTGSVVDTHLAIKSIAQQVPLNLLNIAQFIDATGQVRVADSVLHAVATWHVLMRGEASGDAAAIPAQALVKTWRHALQAYLHPLDQQYYAAFRFNQGHWQLEAKPQ